MEAEKGLFDLSIDPEGKNHLRAAAKWAKFLAIAGFTGLGMLIVFSLVMGLQSTPSGTVQSPDDKTSELAGGIIGSVLVGVLYFFPFLFLFRFAGKMKSAIDTGGGIGLNAAFQNLKITFRYLGVVTIIFLILFLVGILTER